jgi:hypothetical protein
MRIPLAVMAFALSSQTALAQTQALPASRPPALAPSVWPGEGCADPHIPATTGRCGLMLAGNELLRGMPGTVVSIGEPMSPVRLSRFVRGDTAIAYAKRYERQTRTGGVVTFVGLAAVFGESIAILCGKTHLQNEVGKANAAALTFMFSGIAVAGSGFPITWLGKRNARRAIDAHNSTLTRE